MIADRSSRTNCEACRAVLSAHTVFVVQMDHDYSSTAKQRLKVAAVKAWKSILREKAQYLVTSMNSRLHFHPNIKNNPYIINDISWSSDSWAFENGVMWIITQSYCLIQKHRSKMIKTSRLHFPAITAASAVREEQPTGSNTGKSLWGYWCQGDCFTHQMFIRLSHLAV